MIVDAMHQLIVNLFTNKVYYVICPQGLLMHKQHTVLLKTCLYHCL